AIAFIAATFVGVVGGLFYRDRVRTANGFLSRAQQEFATQNFDRAISDSESAWGAVRLLPWQSDLRESASNQLKSAREAKTAASVHQLVDQLRFLDFQSLSDRRLKEIADGCREIWNARAALQSMKADIAPSSPSQQTSESNDAQQKSGEQLRRD